MARAGRRGLGGLIGRLLPTAAVGILSVALVVGASVSPGYPAADLDLHDGSVWVTNSRERLLGKLNKQIPDLETSVQMVNKEFDVLQDATVVLAIDETTNQIQQVDPTSTTLGTPVTLPGNAQVDLGNRTVTVVDRGSGRMWARPIEQIIGIDFGKAKADWELGRGGISAVADDGTPVAVSVERSELVRQVDGEPVAEPLPFSLDADADVDLAVVDGTPVVLDRSGARLWVAGSEEVLADDSLAGAVLQDSSATTVSTAEHDFAAVLGTGAGLSGVTDDGELVPLAQDQTVGSPIRPVVVEGCAYGAFTLGSQSGKAVTACSHTEAKVELIPSFTSGDLEYRVNRDVVVLNDQVSGNVWMVTDSMQLIRDWTKVTPPNPQQGESTENNETVTRVDPKRTEDNRPPTAVDDEFGVRAGRSTAIPVIENDSDPDGDILTVVEPPDISQGTLETVRGGTGLQVTLPPDASGTVTFRYTIEDGRGGTASANVRLRVRSDDQQVDNQPPQQKQSVEPLAITLGSTAERRVLLDWADPDGDDLILVSATAPGDDEVTFTPDGTLTYTDVGTTEGRKVVDLVVSDGVSETSGQLVVNASKKGNIPPLANGDYYQVSVGEELTAKPLANDVGNELSLVSVAAETPGSVVTPNYDDDTFSFRADQPGEYYVGYIVSNGPQAFGIVRVDVVEEETENRAPVATRDVALLPAGGSVLVDPLANDEDLDNDVLVLQNVSGDPNLKIRMVQRQLLEISAVNTPTGPVTLTYTVSDGHESVPGTLVVVPAPPVENSSPVAVRDEVTVRAGDTASVRVLGNDSSPAGLRLEVDEELPEEPSAGHAWVDEEYVRFAAPAQDGEYRLVYQIRDELGQTASAQVRVFVVSEDVPNTPPTPRAVEGRVLAGTTSKILIPMEGIDPEGDAVRLIGINSGPKLGRVTAVDEQWLEYEAYPESGGTDIFSYQVTDAQGATAVGQIRVGVVPRSAVNSPPTTVDDPIAARPGRQVRVPVLANDTDPDGDAFGFTAENPLQFDDMVAEVVDSDVLFEVPAKAGNYLGAYNVMDARGAEATGYVLIESDSSAPLMAPVAQDDQVSSATVANKQVIEVPVLDNDYDPDGPNEDLTVSVPDYGAPEGEGATAVGRNVRVVVGDTMQQVRYQVTDADGLVDSAVITVPGNADAVPALREDVQPQQVIAGEELVLPVNDFVVGTRGRQVALTGDDRIWGSQGEATASSNTEVVFVAPVTYQGPAAAIFEVTDSGSADTARTAVVTVPIEVLPPPEEEQRQDEDEDDPEELNRPPVAQPMTLTIGAGEGPKSLDVARGVTDPDGDQLTFSDLTGETASDTKVSVNGSTITAEADLAVAPGTTMEFRGTVSDGNGGEADIVVTINVTASSKPNPRATDDAVADAVQGEPVSVSVLANDFNPFEADGRPLNVVNATTESGTASATFDGSTVTVTPGGDFVGEAVVRYQIEDATQSADRRSEARIRLTVVGAPDAPGVPRMIEVGDRTTTLQWTAPASNGKDIQQYTVTGTGADGSSVSQQCPSNSCTITGLTNNVEYTFRVTATNEVGESDPSGVSAAVRPDVRPETPAAPTVQWGDASVAVAWQAPENNGSPLTQYVLEMRGPNGIETRTLGPGVTSLDWDGLQNGSAYAYRVQAHNSAPEPSNFSAWSAEAVPAGEPDAPTSVTVGDNDQSGAFGQTVTVSWGEVTGAAANGDAVTTYTIYRNGSQVGTANAGTTSFTDSGLSLGEPYSYTVAATNKAGQGNQSGTSNSITPYRPPNISAPKATKGDRSMSITWTADSGAGGNITYQVKRSGGSWVTPSSNTSHTFTGLTGGSSYSAELRACTSGQNGDLCATSGASNSVVPWEPPSPPELGVNESAQKSVTFTWNGKTSNNNGASAEVQLDRGNGWQTVGASGSETKGDNWDQSFTYKARMVNEHGQASSVVQRTGKTDPKPTPKVVMSKGSRKNLDTCVSEYCHYVVYNVSNFLDNAGGSVSCQLTSDSGYGFQRQSVSVGSDGSGRQEGAQVYGAVTGQGWVQATCSGNGESATSARFTW